MILDFDEILINIKNPQIKKYLQESITSYSMGNYRSAILAVWIAAMFDLVKKFEILVDQREPSAKHKWDNLKPKIEAHTNWEKLLIESAKDIDMISKYEADKLEALRITRNRYAHPSFDEIGVLFDPTPEEVRYFIRSLYDIVLSQPAQLGAFYVTQLLEKIKSPTFFTTNLFTDEIFSVKDSVIETINKINKKQIPRLIKHLFKALDSPANKEHELNILCFIVNLWDISSEVEVLNEISRYWDAHIDENNQLRFTVIESILNCPEKIAGLSGKSQQKIEEFLIAKFLKGNRNSISFTNFLSYADVLPLAQSILEAIPVYIVVNEAIKQRYHYLDLLGEKSAVIFGEAIFNKTREALKTKDGYRVRDCLEALRKCDIWKIVDAHLSSNEEVSFANELISSLNANNYETMSLLSFNERNNIPIKWVTKLLHCWSDKLQNNHDIQRHFTYYFDCYLGLVQRHESELGKYINLEKDLEIVDSKIAQDLDAFSSIEKLKSNDALWNFLQKLLTEGEDIMSLTSLRDFF